VKTDLVVTVSGSRVHVVDTGEVDVRNRVPVVLIHGTAGSTDAWASSVPLFAQERRTLALDLPGHGQSDVGDVASSSIASFATCVARVLETRGIDHAVWIGNSIGGHVALHAAVHASPRVRGLVLVNATGAHSASELDAFMHDPKALRARAGVARDTSLLHTALPLMFSNATSAAARRFLRVTSAARPGDVTQRTHAAIQAIVSSRDASLYGRLTDVRVPTLVVWGEDDRLLEPDNATRLLGIVGARLEKIAASGHMPHIETPAEFHRVVAPFLRTLDGRGGEQFVCIDRPFEP